MLCPLSLQRIGAAGPCVTPVSWPVGRGVSRFPPRTSGGGIFRRVVVAADHPGGVHPDGGIGPCLVAGFVPGAVALRGLVVEQGQPR